MHKDGIVYIQLDKSKRYVYIFIDEIFFTQFKSITITVKEANKTPQYVISWDEAQKTVNGFYVYRFDWQNLSGSNSGITNVWINSVTPR